MDFQIVRFDAGLDPSDRYINEPGKGPSFHTNEFMDGYNDGFNECGGDGGDGDGGGGNFGPPQGGDEIQPQPDSDQEGIDWYAACQVAHTILGLQIPCDELVTPSNELTSKG